MEPNSNINVYRPEPQQYGDGVETNLYAIAEQICSAPPQPPCTIELMMDHDIQARAQSELDDFEIELLHTFTLGCMKSLFGENPNPFQLSETQFERLNDYIHSIGYHVIVTKIETDTSYQVTMSFQRYSEYETARKSKSAGTDGDGGKKNPLEHLRKYMRGAN